MKTIKKIFLGIVLSTLVFVLTSCFSSDTTSLKITKLPNTSFNLCTDSAYNIDELMRVEVTSDGSTTQVILSIVDGELKVSDSKFEGKMELRNFDLSKAGSFTASINYHGVTSYFDYQVLEDNPKFAGGDGSVNNPYQIATAEQFMNMDKVDTTSKYFKLLNDISFDGIEESIYVTYFEGVFDGCGKKLYNIVDAEVFLELRNCNLKNTDFIFRNVDKKSGVGVCKSITGKTTLENVNVYGFQYSHNNAVPFAGYLGIGLEIKDGKLAYDIYKNEQIDGKTVKVLTNPTDVTLINCNNYMDIVGQSDKVSAFFAFTFYGLEKLTMINCHNYGHLEATNVGLVSANTIGKNYVGKTIELNLSGCSNEGKMVALEEKNAKNLFAATGENDMDFTKDQLDGKREVVRTLCSEIGAANADAMHSKLEVDETTNEYVLAKNENGEELAVAYVVVSLTVPAKVIEGRTTNRPCANSEKIYFDSDKINLGLFATEYTLVNVLKGESVPASATPLFGDNVIYVSGNTLYFVSDGFSSSSEYGFNPEEAPYFTIYAYNENDELVAGSVKVSLNVAKNTEE